MYRSAAPSIMRRLLTTAVVFVLSPLIINVPFWHDHVSATTGINQQLNFQGRLYNAQGAVVPDGYYNIQFKIYQDGPGTAINNPGGTLEWTEDWLNSSGNGVKVVNGFISVQLGSITPFGTNVDWNQDTLWLSMNIGSTNTTCTPFTSCTPDGEMVPMKRLSSTPYALNAGMLGGKTAADFIQNQNIAAQTASNFWIDGTAKASTVSAATAVTTPVLRGTADGTASIQLQNAAGTTTLLTADTTNNRIQIGSSTTDSTAISLVLDSYQNGVDGSDPSGGVNGAMYYNTFTNKMRCYQNGGWYDCIDTSGSNFIQNQNTVAQTADFWINGSGRANTLQGDTSIKTPLVDTISAGNLSIGTTTANSITIGKSTTNTSIASSAIYLGTAGTATILQSATNPSGAGSNLSISASNAGSGNTNGGNLLLSGGTGSGTGTNGLVTLTTPTFQTASTQLCASTPCTISQANVDGNGVVIVNTSGTGYVVTLPNPTLGAAAYGRIVYVTSASVNDFTLSVNGGVGIGNLIAMRNNTTATMVWGPSGWTAAGASSSTTLQSAYDNTLQSAGGAELVVSKTSATNGLTIRDSSVNPVNGTLLSVQTSSAAGLLSVNGNVTEYASNAGAETIGSGGATTFPANTWSAINGSTVSRYATAGNYIATGQGSVSVATSATAGSGVKNQLASALTANTTYNVSFTSRLLSGTFTDMNIYYSIDGTAASSVCTTAATSITSIWQKVNCTFKTPASGITTSNTILIRQTTGTARTFYVDNLSVTIAADYNFATDGSVTDNTNFGTNWTSAGAGTVSVTRNTSDGFDASDSANANITAGAANAGLRNRLSSNPLPSTLYRVTVYAKSSNSFTDFKVRYSPNAGTNFVDCVDYNTQAVSTTDWTKITCYIKTDATALTTPYVYFVENASAARSFGVDAFNMSISTVTTPNVQVGGGVNGGPTTLFTLDKGASAPIASDNDALLGSMYYDTTLGKLQCYEADGWGACGSSPDNIITISPEYTNAVLHGTGIGTMTSDICSDTLNINDGSSSQPTICGTNETYNFYKWTSPQSTMQTYGIYVTYQLPATFKSFASGQTSLMGRTDSANATVNYQIYRNSSSGLSACGAAVSVSTGVQTSWQIGTASGGADPSTCSFSGGDSIVFRISVSASQNANAYVGNLNFTFSNR